MQPDRTLPVDVLFILGTGSQWHNNELRYALRSIHKYLSNYRRIFIVGEDPGFTSPLVTILPHRDELGPTNADGNITRKILHACACPDLAEHFIMMNDDYLFVSPIDAHDIYPMHKGDMASFPEHYFQTNSWRLRLQATRDVLLQKQLPTLHFDYHAPLILQKSLFPDAVSQFNYHEGIGYCTRSMYGNIHLAQVAKQITFEKQRIFRPYTVADINAKAANALFLSYNDNGINNALKIWLANNFTQPSPFESGDVDDIIHTVTQWFANGCDYDTGTDIFASLRKFNNLNKLFQTRCTPQLHEKLKYQLAKFIKE